MVTEMRDNSTCITNKRPRRVPGGGGMIACAAISEGYMGVIRPDR